MKLNWSFISQNSIIFQFTFKRWKFTRKQTHLSHVVFLKTCPRWKCMKIPHANKTTRWFACGLWSTAKKQKKCCYSYLWEKKGYNKNQGAFKISVVCVSLLSRLPTGLRRAEIFERRFRNAPKNVFFKKTCNQGPLQGACGGLTPEIRAKNRNFRLGGALYTHFTAARCFGPILGFVLHLWSLKKVAECNFVSKRLKFVSTVECFQTWAFIFEFSRKDTFSDTCFIFANFCLPYMFP